MLTMATSRPVYLACGVTDVRKSIDALAALVQLTFHLNPCSPAQFVFYNRGRTQAQNLGVGRGGLLAPLSPTRTASNGPRGNTVTHRITQRQHYPQSRAPGNSPPIPEIPMRFFHYCLNNLLRPPNT